MTRREAMRQAAQAQTLIGLGFTPDEAEALRRVSMTLHRWHERECGNGSACLVRGRQEGEEFTYDDEGFPYLEFSGVSGKAQYSRVPDRERGAYRRLRTLINRRNEASALPLRYYIQSDPRGAALYLLRPGDVPVGEPEASYYTRGICVF